MSVCDIETSTVLRPRSEQDCCDSKKKSSSNWPLSCCVSALKIYRNLREFHGTELTAAVEEVAVIAVIMFVKICFPYKNRLYFLKKSMTHKYVRLVSFFMPEPDLQSVQSVLSSRVCQFEQSVYWSVLFSFSQTRL